MLLFVIKRTKKEKGIRKGIENILNFLYLICITHICWQSWIKLNFALATGMLHFAVLSINTQLVWREALSLIGLKAYLPTLRGKLYWISDKSLILCFLWHHRNSLSFCTVATNQIYSFFIITFSVSVSQRGQRCPFWVVSARYPLEGKEGFHPSIPIYYVAFENLDILCHICFLLSNLFSLFFIIVYIRSSIFITRLFA